MPKRPSRPPVDDEGASKRAKWIVLALLASVALLVWLWPRGEERRASPTKGDGANDPSAMRAGAGARDRGEGQGGAVAAASSVPDLPRDRPVFPENPAVPDEAPPYSPDTLPLAEAIDPEISAWDDVPTDPEGTFFVRVRPEHYQTRAPQPIVIELEVVDRTKARQSVSRAEASIKSATSTKEHPTILTQPFTAGSDNLYRAKFDLDRDQQNELKGHVLVQAQVQLSTGKVYLVSTSVVYTRVPDGRIVGNWRDEKRDGSLYIGCEVQIDQPGLFQVRGELFGPGFEPIAESKVTATLQPGTQRLELHFFGKALYDRKVDGPYRLRFVYLSQAFLQDGYDAVGPVLDDAYTTAAYRAVDFSSAKYEAPSLVGEVVGPDSPSQRDKPPPLFVKRADGPTLAAPGASGTTMPMSADYVTEEDLAKKTAAASSANATSSAVAPPAPPR